FKSRVLETAITQINEHTDIKATYEQHKQGRTITGFSFKFKQKQIRTEAKKNKNIGDFFNRMTDSQRLKFGSKLAYDERVQSEYSHLIGTG
ncbi:replication initiation protein, partial [Escherichia coli]